MNASTIPPFAAQERAAVHVAAQWLARLHAGSATAQDHAAFARWRAEHPTHEQAWQRAERMQAQWGLIKPALAATVLGRPRGNGRRQTLRALGGLGIALPIGYVAWQAQGTAWTADHRTARAERRHIALPDGTSLWLNGGSAVDVAYTPAARTVRLLRGEVLVQTGADAAAPTHRPFVLTTRLGTLEPLGTRFVVRDAADNMALTVQEGAVAVRTQQGQMRTAEAGQALRFSAHGISPAEPADPYADRWSAGLLVAQGQPLGDFLQAIGRYRAGIVQCDPAVAGLRISGAFQIDRSDAVLDALPRTLPVRVVWHTRYWVRVLPATRAG